MIDVSKIRVGDKITIYADVMEIDHGSKMPIRIGDNSWVEYSDIATHTPREFKAGDRVQPINPHEGSNTGTILCVDGNEAWVKWDHTNNNYTRGIQGLRHADEAP